MIQTQEFKDRFLQLPRDEQYRELLQLFADLQHKNNHCLYIYTQLRDHPEKFDTETMNIVINDLFHVYERIHNETDEQKKAWLAKSADYVKKIHEQEQQEREQDNEICESILTF